MCVQIKDEGATIIVKRNCKVPARIVNNADNTRKHLVEQQDFG